MGLFTCKMIIYIIKSYMVYKKIKDYELKSVMEFTLKYLNIIDGQ